jgi:hypothetical protein
LILVSDEEKGDRIVALKLNCSKCNSYMQQGVVVDLSYAGILRSMWVEDQAENSVVAGIPITINEK